MMARLVLNGALALATLGMAIIALGVVVPGVFFPGVYLLDLAMLTLAIAGVLYLTRRADAACRSLVGLRTLS